jgi:hypothetical protein
MRPLWPLLYLEGMPESLPPARLTVRDLVAEEAADVEAVWFGWDRTDQYRYWSSRPGARTFAAMEGDTPVAVGCLSRSRDRYTLLHMAVVDKSLMNDSVSAAATLAPSSVLLAAPGVSAVVPYLVDAGWRVIEHDLYCATETDLVEAERMIPHPGLM